MAFINVTFRSHALNIDTPFSVILPENCEREDIPTLYLLHGMYGNHSSWERKTAVERYANKRRIAVVMPDGENGFYQDMKYGKNYFAYVSEELVDYTRRIFRLSVKRENTFICGLSMGGYGAFNLALRRPDQYAAAASLSGCVDILARLQSCPWEREAKAIWGEDYKNTVQGSVSDNKWLMENFEAASPKPRLFACCGKQDILYEDNLAFRDYMRTQPFDYTYEEGEGIHDWVFWDTWLPRALEFLMG